MHEAVVYLEKGGGVATGWPGRGAVDREMGVIVTSLHTCNFTQYPVTPCRAPFAVPTACCRCPCCYCFRP